MTPVGHASISYIAGSWYKPYLVFFIVGGVLPDIDFVLLPFSFFNEVHRVITHNVFFVLLSAIIFVLFFKNKYSKYNLFLIVVLTGLLHLFIDSIIDSNPSNGIGVGLLWPLSGKFYSPFNLVQPDGLHNTGWHNLSAMILTNLKYFIFEIPFLFMAFLLFVYKRMYPKDVNTKKNL